MGIVNEVYNCIKIYSAKTNKVNNDYRCCNDVSIAIRSSLYSSRTTHQQPEAKNTKQFYVV